MGPQAVLHLSRQDVFLKNKIRSRSTSVSRFLVPFRLSIQQQLFLLVVVVSGVLCLAIGGLVHLRTVQYLEAAQLEDMVRLRALVAQDINRFFEQHHHPNYQVRLPEALGAPAQRSSSANRLLLPEQGSFDSPLKRWEAFNELETTWLLSQPEVNHALQLARQGESLLIQTRVPSHPISFYLHVFRDVGRQDNQLGLYAFYPSDLTRLLQEHLNFERHDSGLVFWLRDAAGVPLAYAADPGEFDESPPTPRTLRSSNQLMGETSIPVPGGTWTLTTIRGRSEIQEQAWEMVTPLWGLLAFVFVIFASGGFLVSRKIGVSVKQVVEQAERLSAGRYLTPEETPLTRQNELDAICQALLQISDGLRGMEQEATRFIEGEATRIVQPRSNEDSMASTFNRMIEAVHQREGRLKEQGELNETILNSLTEAIFIVQPDGQIIRTNPVAASWLEGNPAETANLMHLFADEQQLHEQVLKQLQHHLELQQETPDLLQQTLEAIPLPVIGIRPDSSIALVNDRFLAATGYETSLLNQAFGTLLPSEFQDKHEEYVDHFFDASSLRSMGQGVRFPLMTAKGGKRYFEVALIPLHGENPLALAFLADPATQERWEIFRLVYFSSLFDSTENQRVQQLKKMSGEEIPVLVSTAVLHDRAGMLNGAVVAMRDLTSFQRVQRQLQQSAKLASLGEMATGVAHEINQPLTFINGVLFDLVEDLNDGVPLEPQQTLQDLKESQRQVQRITKIIQHMRLFGRQHSDARQPVRLREIINNVMLLLGKSLRNANLEVDLTYPEDEELLFQANPIQLEQVFINLLQNIIDAMEELVLPRERRWVHIQLKRQRGNGLVLLEDNGPGIPEEVVERIFDPFFTTKGPNKGTGLGLSISLGIIEAHGGRLQCRTQVGKGTTFEITLPLSQEA